MKRKQTKKMKFKVLENRARYGSGVMGDESGKREVIVSNRPVKLVSKYKISQIF